MQASFFDLPDCSPQDADVLLVPLPYEGSISYGTGASRAPEAIRRASEEIELWDEELDWSLSELKFSTMPRFVPVEGESTAEFMSRVRADVMAKAPGALPVGIGGDHSVTPPLVGAAARSDDLSDVTVVQFDAHADLREEYQGSRESHASAMRRVVERGANVIAVGIRSAEREEFAFGMDSGRVETFTAQELASGPAKEAMLSQRLRGLEGPVYVTFDIDAFEVTLCPGTGTPQPGGLGWWQALAYLRELLFVNKTSRFIGFDVVEVVPQPHSQVNETVAARLIAKIIAYAFANESHGTAPPARVGTRKEEK
jgi:agmatinase